jgi:hypothetical protein
VISPELKHDLSLGWAWHRIDEQAQAGANGSIEHAELLGQGVRRAWLPSSTWVRK